MSSLKTTNILHPSSASNNIVLDSSGRVLVGPSTSRNVASGGAATVQVESSGFRHLSLVQNSNDDNGVQLNFGKSRGTAVGGTTIVQSGDEIARLRFAGANGSDVETVAAEIRCTIDGTPGVGDMPGRISFHTTADGASSPTERLRITSTGQVRLAGAGITFNGDTATANELDDYEEGTWTPTAGSGATLSSITGTYVKIGKLVYASCTGLVTTTGLPPTGHLGGLPFSGSGSTGAHAVRNSSNLYNSFNGAAYVSDTTIYIQNSTGTGSASFQANLTNVGFGINAIYTVA